MEQCFEFKYFYKISQITPSLPLSLVLSLLTYHPSSNYLSLLLDLIAPTLLLPTYNITDAT